jgi:hypothetical protein
LGELRRLRGNLLRRRDVNRAESCLKEAIEWSRERDAKILELRASRDLAQIYISAGNKNAATTLLKRGLALFSEKLNFPELREIRQVFRDLASDPRSYSG